MITTAERLALTDLALQIEEEARNQARQIETFLADRLREGRPTAIYPRQSHICLLCARDLRFAERSSTHQNICKLCS